VHVNYVDNLENVSMIYVLGLTNQILSCCLLVLTKFLLSLLDQMSSELAELVFIETPYSGDIDRNVRYLMLCGFDAAARHELGVSTHGSMTQHPTCKSYFVPDGDAKWDVMTREGAIQLGQALRMAAKKTVFYEDLGWSRGMKAGMELCVKQGLSFEVRKLDIKNVLSFKAQMISQEFIEDLLAGNDYSHHLS